MALANVAWILASNGLKVLVVDWDLDSPGLHRYFHPFLDPAKVAATPGVIELINDYAWAATERRTGRPTGTASTRRSAARHLGELAIPRGRDTGFRVRRPAEPRLLVGCRPSVDWDNFYDRLGGGQFIDALREDMKAHYDYTLIDSRTGLSDIADICTVHLPDILVDCFTLNDQSIDGRPRSPGTSTSAITTGTSGYCRFRCGSTTRKRRRPTRAWRWRGRKFDRLPAGMAEDEGTTTGRRWRSRTSRSTPSRRRSPSSGTPPGRRSRCSPPTSG